MSEKRVPVWDDTKKEASWISSKHSWDNVTNVVDRAKGSRNLCSVLIQSFKFLKGIEKLAAKPDSVLMLASEVLVFWVWSDWISFTKFENCDFFFGWICHFWAGASTIMPRCVCCSVHLSEDFWKLIWNPKSSKIFTINLRVFSLDVFFAAPNQSSM